MDTDTIGLALIVGGAAFVSCGQLFMQPPRGDLVALDCVRL